MAVMIAMIWFDFETVIESQSRRVVEWLVEKSKVRRRTNLEVRRNNLVGSPSRLRSGKELKEVDLALEEVELQNLRDRENEDDNYEKENSKVDCS